MSQKVNLDALVPRADLETDETASAPSGRPKDTLSVNDLKKGSSFFRICVNLTFSVKQVSGTQRRFVILYKAF